MSGRGSQQRESLASAWGSGPCAWVWSVGLRVSSLSWGRHGVSCQAQTLPVMSAGGPAGPSCPLVPLEELGSGEGPRRARAACGHGAISIRARERVAAAPGILLKAFSLFPVICSAPPGPGHVDNLFVEGKGAQSAGEREMSLFTQPLSAARALPGAAGKGGTPSSPKSGGGGAGQGSPRERLGWPWPE